MSSFQSSTSNFQTSDTPYTPSTQIYNTSVMSYETTFPTPENDFQNSTMYSEKNNSFSNMTDEYNPEEEPETWENEASWEAPPIDLDTPESPPIFEKESCTDPVEYHDLPAIGTGVDMDHRVLPVIPEISLTGMKMYNP